MGQRQRNYKVAKAPFDVNGYEYEVRAATHCILNGELECSVHPHHRSVELCTMMDTLRADWNFKYPFED